MAGIIRVQGVSTHYNTTRVLDNICFEIQKADFVGIVGPNGSGKTTLLNNLGRLIPYQSGRIYLNDQNLKSYRHKEAARLMSAVTQDHPSDVDFRVWDVVMMGRTPHWGFFQRESIADRNLVIAALQMVGIEELAERKLSELSGGEQQRTFIAQAIAQEPDVMLLDEPTSHLDIHYQISIMDALQRLNEERQVTVVAVLHDLNLAAQYCSKIIMLKEGEIAGMGTPQEILQAELIESVYRCKVAVTTHPVTGTPYVVLYSRHYAANSTEEPGVGVKVHIISGGGSGSSLMDVLTNRGFILSAGVLNVGDSDWEKGQDLAIQMVDEMPFSNISNDKKEENLALARKSDVVVVTATPFGPGNQPNAEILCQLAEEGIPIILLDGDGIKDRDYTNGRVAAIYDALRKSSTVFSSGETELVSLILKLTESR